MRILTEKRCENADENRLTEQLVYLGNGCVVRQVKDAKGKVTESDIVVRLVYGDRKVVDSLLAKLVEMENERNHQSEERPAQEG